MKKLKRMPIRLAPSKTYRSYINALTDQHNETVDEIRLIKKKLRINAHFSTKRK